MKSFLVLIFLISVSSLKAQSLGQMESIAKSALRKSMRKANSSRSYYDRFYIRSLKKVGKIKRVLRGHYQHKVFLDSKVSCMNNEREKRVGKCSFVLNRSFRKGSRWTAKINKHKTCFCGPIRLR